MANSCNELNCLANLMPRLANQWSSKNALSPHDVSYKSNKKVWWICSVGHEWQATCKNRTNGSNCPFCAGQRATDKNCIASLMPQWINEFHSEKNYPLTVFNVCFRSNKKIWWKCDRGHEWQQKPDMRHATDGCPYCSNQKAHADYCLASKYPSLAQEWHPLKNDLTPFDITPSSHIKVWWKCEKGHEWFMSPHNRHKGNQIFGCFECQQKSKGEEKISSVICELNLKFERQYKFDECVNKRRLPFDFGIFFNKRVYVIEYQGLQHFVPKSFGASDAKKEFEALVKNDAIKRTFCQNRSIPYLEIPYWDFDNIDKLIREFIK